MASGFDGLRVVAFENRRAGELASLVERFGGRATCAPAMRELPLAESPEAMHFAAALLSGNIDVVIFLTGVGAQAMMSLIERRHPRDQVIEALSRVTRVARGPKSAGVVREWGLTVHITAPEPNTSEDLLDAIEAAGGVAGKRVAVQEYGQLNEQLARELRARGAVVTSVRVYAWGLPEDLGPLHGAIRAAIAGQVEVAVFTSAQQVTHVLQVARDIGLDQELRKALARMVVGSVGPTCTAAIRAAGIGVDFEPDRTRMIDLIQGLARSAHQLLDRKRSSLTAGVDTHTMRRVEVVWPKPASPQDLLTGSAFLKACRREKTDYTPIWIMRQAGRFLREYRELRRKVSFLELCRTPELAAEATLMAVDRLGVDAAIIFSDILLIVDPMGVGLTFDAGEGPRIQRPVRTRKDVDALLEVDPADSLSFVFDAIRMTRRALRPDIPLIGFCGAPFTVASYMIEGGGSRHFQQTKALMYRDAGCWHALLEKLVRGLTRYLNGQIAAGAQVIQLFDSWVGCLSEADYRTFVLPHIRTLIAGITPGVPVIHFGTDTAVLLRAMREAGGNVIGLDWRVDLASTWEMLGYDIGVQGNLDPVVLFASPSEIRRRAKAILDGAAARPGHIFNLGHGVLPTTPVDHVLALVDFVHEYRAQR